MDNILNWDANECTQNTKREIEMLLSDKESEEARLREEVYAKHPFLKATKTAARYASIVALSTIFVTMTMVVLLRALLPSTIVLAYSNFGQTMVLPMLVVVICGLFSALHMMIEEHLCSMAREMEEDEVEEYFD